MNDDYTRAPHRRESKGPAPNAALLIDFDNVTMGIRSNLGHELRKLLDSDIIRGKVSVQRAYADWRRYPQYIVPLAEASIDLIFAPAYGSSKKNATDIRLAIDAAELVFTRPEIGTYILLSGDSDFSSLVLKLKEYGKYVIGVGMRESSSDLLVQNCDEYYSYSTISGLTSAGDMQTQKHDPWQLVERALERMSKRGDVMRSDRLKQVMLELDSAFDEKDLGFSKFNRFLAEAASRDKVGLRKAANGQYEVFTVGGGSGSDEGRPRPSRGGSRGGSQAGSRRASGGRDRTEDRGGKAASEAPAEGGERGVASLRDAYRLLVDAVESLANGREPVRDSEVKREILSRDSAFDEAALGFRKFSRFLQQAHDEGVIDLSQGDDGNYYLSTPGGGGAERRESEKAREPDKPEKTEAREPAARAGGRGSRRGARGLGRRARRGGEEEPAAAASPEPSGSGGRDSEDEAEEEPAGKEAVAEAPAARGESPSTAGSARESGPAQKRPAGRGGLGRFRRGSRGGSGSSGGSTATAKGRIGPVETEAGGSTDDDSGGEGSPAGTSGDSEGRSGGGRSVANAGGSGAGRRGLGRFRRGSRGGRSGAPAGDDGERAASKGGASGDSAEGAAATSASSEVETPPGTAGEEEIIDHMVRNYAGVGRKTAERLVGEFGEDTYRVIDQQPERVGAVLSERRARAVLEAREAELEASGSGS